MTRHLDPDRSPEVKLFPFPIDIETGVCNRCSALVPMTDTAKLNHRDHHRKVDALEAALATVTLTRQLSDPGDNSAVAPVEPDGVNPGSDPTSEVKAAGARKSRLDGLVGESAQAGERRAFTSDPNVPTPLQDDNGSRGGVEDANDSLGAGLPPGVAQAPDAPTSPGGSSGAAKGTGRGSGGSGELPGSAPAGTTSRLHLVDTEPPDYWGRFGR